MSRCDDLVVGDPDRLAIVPVQRIVVRDHRVEIVVAARELQDDQHGILLAALPTYLVPPIRSDVLLSGELIFARRDDQLQHFARRAGRRSACAVVVPADLAPLLAPASVSSFLVSAPTSTGPSRSRQLVDQLLRRLSVPCAFSRLMMRLHARQIEVLPTCSATKLMRAINEPLLIHSLPVCQPSTDGGLSRSWPI